MFARAGQPELVRSNQKDVYYLGFLREGIGQIYRNFQGKIKGCTKLWQFTSYSRAIVKKP